MTAVRVRYVNVFTSQEIEFNHGEFTLDEFVDGTRLLLFAQDVSQDGPKNARRRARTGSQQLGPLDRRGGVRTGLRPA